MRKFILFFILFIITLVFVAFFINVFKLQKDYFNNNGKGSPQPLVNDVLPMPTLSLYTDYSKDNYDKALAFRSILILYFTSNWCKECSNQEIVNREVYDELNATGIVFLQAHILDSETTTETDALAKKFDVTKESSFVILDKNGAVNYKYVGEITKELLKTKIMEVIYK